MINVNKKELSLDDLDSVSGGIGSTKTSGMEEFFPKNKTGFHDWCLLQGLSPEKEHALEQAFGENGATFIFDGEWHIKS